MRNNRRTGVLAVAASLALAAGGLVAVLPAAAAGTEWIDAGALTISTSTNAVTFGDATQPLGASGCNLTPTSGALLEFAGLVGGASAPVGYKNGSIGVNERVSALCNLVDPATTEGGGIESLELKLGDSLVNFAGRPLQASGASLDLRMGVRTLYTYNRKSTVTAQAFLAGAPVGDPLTLIQGSGISTDPNTTYCAFSSYGQTCEWDIAPGRFDTLRLTAVAGAFGVVGESTLALKSEVDKALDCLADPTLSQGNASVTYVGNADGSTCGELGVTLTAGNQEVQFLKPLEINPDAQFIFEIDWKLPRPSSPAFAIPEATIDFEFKDDSRIPEGGDAIPVADRSVMLFCPEYLYSGSGPDRALTGLTKPLPGDDTAAYDAALADLRTLDMVSEEVAESAIGTQFACIADTRTTRFTDDELIVEDTIYLIGDAKMRL